jgi:hypothetical protein
MNVTGAPGASRFTVDWLSLREAADAAARADALLDPLRDHLAAAEPAPRPLVIRDLGCGTGSMGRWLSGRLRGPQQWIMHDQDPDLLERAAAGMPRQTDDGAPISVETQAGDLARLRAADLAGTSVVTASALLDLLTADEVDRLAAACAEARCAALLTLSVAGRVEFSPADPLDGELAAAFNAHQRRVTRNRRLLGPDAGSVAARAFTRHGALVRTCASPWRLNATPPSGGSADGTAGPAGPPTLLAEWLQGWVAAAREQRPDLARPAASYLSRRLAACAAGELTVAVHHIDLLAVPAPSDPSGGVPA